MILNQLSLRNYKQYAHLDLEFREGLVGIIGKNGAGKSTLFEAILYCLFGKDESNKNLVRSSFVNDPKANVELELVFSLGETRYRVARSFRGKALAVGAELYRNDEMIAKGVSPVNEELVKLLHMERDAFKRSVFSGQKELSELSDTSGEARKRMVRKMLGLDTLDEVQTRINGDIRDLNSRVMGQKQNLLSEEESEVLEKQLKDYAKALKDKRLALKQELENLKQTESGYQLKKQAFDVQSQRLNQHHGIERALAQARERMEGLGRQLQETEQKILSLRRQKEQLEKEKTEFAQFESDRKTFQGLELERQKQLNRDAVSTRLADASHHIAELTGKIETLNRQLSGREENERLLLEKQAAVAAAETAIEQKRGELRELEKQIGGINSSIRERSEKLDTLRKIGKEGACPTCLQPLLEGYERVVAELADQVHALESRDLQSLELRKKEVIEAGSSLKTRQNELRQEADGLLANMSRLAEVSRQWQSETALLQKFRDGATRDELILREIGEVHFDQQQYNALKNKLAEQEPRYLEFQKTENYVTRQLPAAEESLKTTSADMAKAGQLLKDKTDELSSLNFSEAEYLAAKEAFTGFDEALARQSGIVRSLEKEVLETENTLARAKEKLNANEQIQAQIAGKMEEMELLRKLYEHLGYFKTEILEKVSPGISREASELFSRITRGKYESILVDEHFDFSIADGGQYYPIERFSGGEIDLANFCLRIAVTKAIMDLSGAAHSIEFLAFDEIFGSQDEERRLEMMLALHYLQEQFRQIYIVSHIESLRDYFPHLLEVQAAPAGSTAVWR